MYVAVEPNTKLEKLSERSMQADTSDTVRGRFSNRSNLLKQVLYQQGQRLPYVSLSTNSPVMECDNWEENVGTVEAQNHHRTAPRSYIQEVVHGWVS